jgi:hypothetical protein
MEYFLNVMLTQFLETQHTCPELNWCLSSIFSSQIWGTEPTFGARHGRDEPRFQTLVHAQHVIGWGQLFQGRLAQHWSRLHEEFLDWHNHHLKLDRKFHSDTETYRTLVDNHPCLMGLLQLLPPRRQ